jgi:hypothetical protein
VKPKLIYESWAGVDTPRWTIAAYVESEEVWEEHAAPRMRRIAKEVEERTGINVITVAQ